MKKGLTEKRLIRMSVIGKLREIGLSTGKIAAFIGETRATVNNDVGRLRRDGALPSLGLRKDAYRNAFAVYVSLLSFEGVVGEGYYQTLLAAVKKYLNVGRLERFFDSVMAVSNSLCVPVCMEEDLPYVRLLHEVFGRPAGTYSTFEDWLREVDVFPQSAAEMEEAIVRSIREARENVAPVWPDNASCYVDAVLEEVLTPREVLVIWFRFGLRSDKKTLEAIGAELSVTKERVLQLVAKAMRKLHGPVGIQRLRILLRGGNDELAAFLANWDRERKLKDAAHAEDSNDEQLKVLFAAGKVVELDGKAISLDILMREMKRLDFSVRTDHCLRNVELKYVGDVIIRDASSLLRTKYFGRKSLKELVDVLASELNLQLGMTLPPWMAAAFNEAKIFRANSREEM